MQVDDGISISKTTFDKINNVVYVEEENKSTGKLVYSQIDLNLGIEKNETITDKIYISDETDYSETVNRNRVFSNYSSKTNAAYSYYNDYSNDIWNIRDTRGISHNTSENSRNAGYLDEFKKSVDTLVSLEVGIIAALGIAASGLVVAGLTAPSGLGIAVGLVTALGGSIAVGYQYWQAVEAGKEVDYYYLRVIRS